MRFLGIVEEMESFRVLGFYIFIDRLEVREGFREVGGYGGYWIYLNIVLERWLKVWIFIRIYFFLELVFRS